MLIHRVIPRTLVNGPGLRFVLWTQGCGRDCPGCFNPETHAVPGCGKEMTIDEILGMIPGDVVGVSVSGGEPFDQAGDLALLFEAARSRGLHTLAYTGYRHDELDWPEARAALEYTDILIDGPFVRDSPARHPWAGSGNQRVLLLRKGAIENEITETPSGIATGELHIDETGTIIATGIFDSEALRQEGNTI